MFDREFAKPTKIRISETCTSKKNYSEQLYQASDRVISHSDVSFGKMSKNLIFCLNFLFFHEETIIIANNDNDWQKMAKCGQKHHFVTKSNVF